MCRSFRCTGWFDNAFAYDRWTLHGLCTKCRQRTMVWIWWSVCDRGGSTDRGKLWGICSLLQVTTSLQINSCLWNLIRLSGPLHERRIIYYRKVCKTLLDSLQQMIMTLHIRLNVKVPQWWLSLARVLTHGHKHSFPKFCIPAVCECKMLKEIILHIVGFDCPHHLMMPLPLNLYS